MKLFIVQPTLQLKSAGLNLHQLFTLYYNIIYKKKVNKNDLHVIKFVVSMVHFLFGSTKTLLCSFFFQQFTVFRVAS